MKVSELVEALEKMKARYGDLPVAVQKTSILGYNFLNVAVVDSKGFVTVSQQQAEKIAITYGRTQNESK